MPMRCELMMVRLASVEVAGHPQLAVAKSGWVGGYTSLQPSLAHLDL